MKILFIFIFSFTAMLASDGADHKVISRVGDTVFETDVSAAQCIIWDGKSALAPQPDFAALLVKAQAEVDRQIRPPGTTWTIQSLSLTRLSLIADNWIWQFKFELQQKLGRGLGLDGPPVTLRVCLDKDQKILPLNPRKSPRKTVPRR